MIYFSFIKLDSAFFLSVEMILILALINLQKLVCKVDQLVKRRAKSGLIRVKVDWNSAKEFVTQHLDKEIKVLYRLYYIFLLTL